MSPSLRGGLLLFAAVSLRVVGPATLLGVARLLADLLHKRRVHGLDAVGVLGFGEFHPAAPNAAGNKGNAANRRVELWILPGARLLTRPMGGTAPE